MDAEEIGNSEQETEVDATEMWEKELDSEGAAKDQTTNESETQVDASDLIDDEMPEEEEGETEEDEDEEDEQESQQQDTPLFTVKVDGEERQVTQDELVRGYSQNSSYTQKSQTLAEDRRAFEEEAEQSRVLREQAIQILETQQAQNQQPEHDQTYWENLKETDPVQWMMERDALRESQMQTQLNQQQLNQLQMQKQQEQAVEMERYIEEQQGRLIDLIPEWTDSKKANTEKAIIIEYGRKVGFTNDELNNAYDARAVATMRKAALYDLLQDKRKGLKPKTHTSMKPGSQPGEPKQLKLGKAGKRLKQSGRVEDLASVFETML